MGPPSYAYVMQQRASTDVALAESLLHLHQQLLAYVQSAFPCTASSPHEDALAAHFASLIGPASQIPSHFTSEKSLQNALVAPAATPFEEEAIARALSLVASTPCPPSSLGNGSVPHVLPQQFPLLMVLSELHRLQQQQRRAAEVNAVLQHQRQELCRASVAFVRHATSPQAVQYKNSLNDMPPVLEQQSPAKPPSPKKRRHRDENPSAKRLRVSAASPMNGFKADNGTEAIVKRTLSPSTSPCGSVILQQLIDDDSPAGDSEKKATTSSTIDSDSPHRHHPNYLPKRDPEAALLEDYATVYMLNGLGGLCEDRLEKSMEEALFDMPSDSSSPSPDVYFSGCSSDGADASPFPRASSNSGSNDDIMTL
ncbi:hypothetical protein AAVH_22896 [Aphelenchoides avenae]|nr:hypothetical protein AAVH_22896 [Aphelenchus avenae]